jgi:tetratricopeptide (TPR) repeat protein
MHEYGVSDVERLLRLPRSTIRALIAAGFVSPARGPRNTWRFSFQDLIVLRTAQALADAKVPQRRITRSVRELRRHLPEAMPLSGLSICAVADRVVVKEGGSRWQAESGQYLLAFEGDPADGSLSVIERRETVSAPALAEDFSERINRGLALHEAGRLTEAERVYRELITLGGNDPVLFYNLGVLLEDMDRKPEAVGAYQAALRGNPDLADCHYNLALLCETLGKPRDAIRHMSQYRRLLASQSK